MTKQEFLAMSLPYEIKLIYRNDKSWPIIMAIGNLDEILHTNKDYKPILRPLSDLTKEIEHKGKVFKPSFALSRDFKNAEDFIYLIIQILNGEEEMKLIEVMKYCPLNIVQKLIEWHFDLFDGIKNNEAINVNDLETNPYK